MAAYGDSGSMHDYEYDHFIPLELGGAVNDPRNLWPEPEASPNPKDSVENTLRQKVCDKQTTLAHAQHAIASNWIKLAGASSAPGSGTTAPGGSAPAPSSAGGRCSLTASYSSHYNDYDIYVHSNQPDHTITVTDSSGRHASWHTDSTGYADVYFKAPQRHRRNRDRPHRHRHLPRQALAAEPPQHDTNAGRAKCCPDIGHLTPYT
jgi:hypothetical protein